MNSAVTKDGEIKESFPSVLVSARKNKRFRAGGGFAGSYSRCGCLWDLAIPVDKSVKILAPEMGVFD
jgi:hypothetical protein